MCGVIGIVGHSAVNQLLYDGLLLLQHRGQDAAGIATAQGKRIHIHRNNGLVRDVFRTRDMRNLQGRWALVMCVTPRPAVPRTLKKPNPSM